MLARHVAKCKSIIAAINIPQIGPGIKRALLLSISELASEHAQKVRYLTNSDNAEALDTEYSQKYLTTLVEYCNEKLYIHLRNRYPPATIRRIKERLIAFIDAEFAKMPPSSSQPPSFH